MKKLLTIFFYFVYILSFGQKISGRLIDVETNKALSNGNIYLLRHEKTKDTIDIYYWENKKFKIIQSTKSDTLGYYLISKISPRKYTIVAEFFMPQVERFDYMGSVKSIDYNVNINNKENYKRNFKLPVTCKFEKTRNQMFCPVCKKTDKVIPIEFGLPIPIFDSLGNSKPQVEIYHAGCIMDKYCNPTKYCKRCNRQF